MRSVWKPFALLAAAAFPLMAQEPAAAGNVVGRVTDRASGAPIVDATITIAGTVQSARTNDEGRFRISGVRAGAVSVRATRIGYAAVTRAATVAAGQDLTLDLQMAQSAVQIDEVVVTATGETQLKRESGMAIATVETTPERLATTTNIAQLLTAKAPGVYVNSPGGTTGSANRIRIRGANSVSLTNEPLLIVDGVRASNEINGTGSVGVGGQGSSRLNDINPDDIESIEIIKGPAAASMYGTAAANGVIQIRTKRGRAGSTRWNVYSEAGSQKDVIDYPSNYTQVDTNGDPDCTLDAQVAGDCTADGGLTSHNPLEQYSPFITGYRSSVGASVTGGGDVATYFISGDVDRDQGVYEPNFLNRIALRANLTGQLRSNVTTQIMSSYSLSRLKFPQNDNNILGIVSSGLLGSAFDDASHGYISGQTPQEIFAIDTRENVERFIGSSQITWQALPWLSATGQAGVDYLDRRNKETTFPNKVFFNQETAEGDRTANATQIWNYTANGSATGAFQVNTDLRSTTTVGVQFTNETIQGVEAFGAKIIAGTGSLEGTSARFTVGEFNTENRTLGALIQQQFAWRDRLFATLAVRTDNNSAFGSNFGWIKYPAASLSWVASDESFFPQNNVVSLLRLRTAYGESGQRPNFRDAIDFFNVQTITTESGDFPGIQVGGVGNPDLKPESSREIELGFELGLFQDRISIDFTSYNKRTKDLLIARPLPPSLGLATTQFDNLGESSNKGIELAVSGRAWEMRGGDFALDFTASMATNDNKLVSIGKQPDGSAIPPIVIGIQRHAEGFPLGGYWDESYTYDDADDNGIISSDEVTRGALTYLGNPIPRREFTFNPRVTLFKYAELGALLDHRSGFKQFNNTARFRCNFFICQEAYDPSAPLDLQARNIAHQMQTDAGYVEDSKYTKLREMSLSLLAPPSWAAKLRAGEARLTLAGRNLKTWTDYTGFDPEVNSQPTTAFSQSDFLTQPPLRIFSARLTLSF